MDIQEFVKKRATSRIVLLVAVIVVAVLLLCFLFQDCGCAGCDLKNGCIGCANTCVDCTQCVGDCICA
ncbi:MAG: hypothetical protein J6L81_04335 [Clostridia bacterium]|nr:hypothetical protein [Clostridia bacterium]